MSTKLKSPEIICKVCQKIFKSQKGLNIHTSRSSLCRKVRNKQKEDARERAIKNSVDHSETLEDDPPMDWEIPWSPGEERGVLDSYHAATRGQNHESASSVLPNLENSPINGNNDNIDGIVVEEFPQPAGESKGIGATKFDRFFRCQTQSKPFAPFADEAEWQLAEWLMQSGSSQTEMDRFLRLPIVRERTKPSFKDKQRLLENVDSLPPGPNWTFRKLVVNGDATDYNGNPVSEELDLWCRDPVECVQEIMGNPMFRDHMCYAPKKLYTSENKEDQIINEMWTAQWWWDIQTKLPSGATVAPLILASDKTQLSQFSGDKQAWPVYITIGNVAKKIRRQPSKRAMVLLGYIPVTKFECISDANKRKESAYRFFHYCMTLILAPLQKAGLEGVDITCADNHIHHVYPILASYIADYPEQCLVACNKENSCPVCTVPPEQHGNPDVYPMRNPEEILKALNEPTSNLKFNLRAIPHPFWATLPYTDIFTCFTPDLLHQLHKGVFKDHLVQWCIQLAGAAEIDQRFKAMPDHPSLRHFKAGISKISQWTDREFKEMEKVFAGLVCDAIPPEAMMAVRAVIDFIHYASFPSHSTETLRRLRDALETFHKHKDIFVRLGVRSHFRIPKIHMMEHYINFIIFKGAADGFNTELPERLHIDYAKEGYRVSNKKGFIEQMIKYLNRQEAIHSFRCFLEWRTCQTATNEKSETHSAILETGMPRGQWKIPKNERKPNVSLQTIIEQHGATDIVEALRTYLQANHPNCKVEPSAHDLVDLLNRISKDLSSPQGLDDNETKRDIIRAVPAIPASLQKCAQDAQFDTVLVHEYQNAETVGLDGYRVARVHAIFWLPNWFDCKATLAYVQWFTNFSSPIEPLRMSRLSYSLKRGQKHGSIIPIDSILRSCHLIPKFSRTCSLAWNKGNSLDLCSNFVLNSHLSLYMFQMCDGDFVLKQ